MSRARPMSPDQRREALVEVTLQLLREHGRQVTTRQIAEAAGIAEGTVFRVFDTKDDLIDAAVARAFAPGRLIDRIEAIDPDLPLRGRLLALTAILQQRFRATFALMQRMGMVHPPDHLHDSPAATAWRTRLDALMIDVVGADADRLRVPAGELVHALRLLTFAGSHDQVADNRLLSPEQIVTIVLDGLRDPSREES